MPNRWAVANGNWSSAATWSGSLIPTASDDVYSNNFTVNVDTSFQVLSIRNTASASAVVAGGSFNFNSGSISASLTSATGIVPGATNLITVTAGSGTVTISAPNTAVPGGAATNSSQTINHSGNCDLILTGSSFIAAGAVGMSSGFNINKSSTGTIYILGNLLGSTFAGSIGGTVALNSIAGNTVINGNVRGSLTSTGATNTGIIQTSGNLTIVGSVTGGEANTTNYGISFSGTTLTITGSITGGAGVSSAPAVFSSTANTVIVSGSCIAANSPAIISSNASATNIFTGPFINTNDTMAVQCVDMVLTTDASTSWNFGNITLFSPERLAFYPSASDIRQGTTYADGTVSGSLAMPPPSAVIAGTPTDNTTGSAVLTPAQLQDAVWGRDLSQMTETGSIGHRLARVSTTGTTGAQIASYLL